MRTITDCRGEKQEIWENQNKLSYPKSITLVGLQEVDIVNDIFYIDSKRYLYPYIILQSIFHAWFSAPSRNFSRTCREKTIPITKLC